MKPFVLKILLLNKEIIMTTQQMNYFLTLAKFSNYTKASNELGISVSTLSRQILAMEEELNVQLFQRDNKNVSLTRCGHYMHQELQRIYCQYQTMAENVRNIYQGYNGALSIGILDDITLNGKLQEGFERFKRKHSDITLSLERGSYRGLIDGLVNGKYDCIISFLFALGEYDFLKYKIIEKITEGIIISSKNPLSKYDYFDLYEFRNQTFILLDNTENSYIANEPLAAFKKYNIHPKILYAPNLDAALLMVEAGMGIAFSYGKSVGSYNPSMKFLPIRENERMTFSPKLVLAWDEKNDNAALQAWSETF